MNTVKFRAWNKESEKMTSWDYISKVKNLQKLMSLYHVNLMQFTGLLDKNGVDIYEGDIIKTDCTQILYTKLPNASGLGAKTRDIRTNGIVVCVWEMYGFKFNHIDKSKHTIFIPSFEIIGNIYEHGDLLK